MQVGYRASARFTPDLGETWSSYVAWSKLPHLEEVVGLDSILNPSLVDDYSAGDWDHLVLVDHLFGCFGDFESLRNRVRDVFDPTLHQWLAVVREPAAEDLARFEEEGFQFAGFELLEDASAISALTNCGGFEGAFTAEDLCPNGLLPDLHRAREVRARLKDLSPEEDHADCVIWAVWRRRSQSPS